MTPSSRPCSRFLPMPARLTARRCSEWCQRHRLTESLTQLLQFDDYAAETTREVRNDTSPGGGGSNEAESSHCACAAWRQQAVRPSRGRALGLTVYGGEFYVLVGLNGAGKTTTLRWAALRTAVGAFGVLAAVWLISPSR